VTPEEFDALFDSFRSAVFRLEALPAYAGQEDDRMHAFYLGEPLPERSVRTEPWLARIAMTTITERKSWIRVRVVDEPLTEFQRYQLEPYRESQAAGEQILIVARAELGDAGEDFWLFDAGAPDARGVLMHYDEDHNWVGADLVTDPAAGGHAGSAATGGAREGGSPEHVPREDARWLKRPVSASSSAPNSARPVSSPA
jgi:hypothetical protein